VPYRGEHSCRVQQPGAFQPDSFRRIKNGKLSIVIGKLKGEAATTTQAFRYPTEDWKESEARKHCSDNGGSFEPAMDSAIRRAAGR
jgi:hypothetical protein